MNALSKMKIKKAFFISPIVDMEKVILNMMTLANVSEQLFALSWNRRVFLLMRAYNKLNRNKSKIPKLNNPNVA